MRGVEIVSSGATPHDGGDTRVRMPVRVHAFEESEALARRLARLTGLPHARVTVHRFPDGESLVRIRPPAGEHAVLVRTLDDPNRKLVEILLAADALRRAGAGRLTLVAPYLGYMRQDAQFHAGEPISQRVLGACLGRAFDRVLCIEAHLHRITRLAEILHGGRSVSAAPALAAWLERFRDRPLLVGPDEESAAWVRAIARAARLPWTVGHKVRHGDRAVAVRFRDVPACAHAVIVDDIASSGGTMAAAARALRRAGVGTVDAVVIHAVFSPGALRRIHAAGIRTVVSCDTIPHPTNAIAVAPLLADALAWRTVARRSPAVGGGRVAARRVARGTR